MKNVLVLMIAVGSCSIDAMFTTAAVKKVVATAVAAGYVATAPKIKDKVERWQTHQQWKREVKKQNEPVHSGR